MSASGCVTLQARLELALLQTLQEQHRTTALRLRRAIELPVSQEATIAALHRLESRQLVWRDSREMWRISPEGEQHLQKLEAAAVQPAAQPVEVVTPRVPCAQVRRSLGTGDARPPVLRPGAMDAMALPSLVGQQRRWRGQ